MTRVFASLRILQLRLGYPSSSLFVPPKFSKFHRNSHLSLGLRVVGLLIFGVLDHGLKLGEL